MTDRARAWVALGLLVGVAVFPDTVFAGRQQLGLRTGVWYGRIRSVSSPQRTFVLETACSLNKSGQWVDAPHLTVTVHMAKHIGFTIYFRPSGDLATGHPQSANLALFVSIANAKPSADFPAGWAVTFDRGTAVLVDESSGITDGPSCLTSTATRRLVAS